MRTKFMATGEGQRSLRVAVWIGRGIGWALVLVASLGIGKGGFKSLTSIGLWLVAVVWILAFELFLRFFDRYLSRN